MNDVWQGSWAEPDADPVDPASLDSTTGLQEQILPPYTV